MKIYRQNMLRRRSVLHLTPFPCPSAPNSIPADRKTLRRGCRPKRHFNDVAILATGSVGTLLTLDALELHQKYLQYCTRACGHSCRRDHAGDEMNPGREALVRLVVSRRHRPELFDSREEIPGPAPPSAHFAVMLPGRLPVLLRGYHRRGAALLNVSEQPVRAGRPVPGQGPELKILKQVRRPLEVVRLAGKDHEPHQAAERVRDCGSPARQAAAGASDALLFGPPFAPEAFWRAWTTVPSTNTHSKSNSSDKALKTRSKTPFRAQRRNRLNTLFQLPKRSGRPRRGDPVRNRQSAAPGNCLLSAAVTPGSAALPGSMGPARAHMASVSAALSAFICHSARSAFAAVPAVIGADYGVNRPESQPDCPQALASKLPSERTQRAPCQRLEMYVRCSFMAKACSAARALAIFVCDALGCPYESRHAYFVRGLVFMHLERRKSLDAPSCESDEGYRLNDSQRTLLRVFDVRFRLRRLGALVV